MKKKIAKGLIVIALALLVGIAIEGIKPSSDVKPNTKTIKVLVDPPGV